jgi:hypothetical protein
MDKKSLYLYIYSYGSDHYHTDMRVDVQWYNEETDVVKSVKLKLIDHNQDFELSDETILRLLKENRFIGIWLWRRKGHYLIFSMGDDDEYNECDVISKLLSKHVCCANEGFVDLENEEETAVKNDTKS